MGRGEISLSPRACNVIYNNYAKQRSYIPNLSQIGLHYAARKSAQTKTAGRIHVGFTTLPFRLAVPDRYANNNFDPTNLVYRFVQFLIAEPTNLRGDGGRLF